MKIKALAICIILSVSFYSCSIVAPFYIINETDDSAYMVTVFSKEIEQPQTFKKFAFSNKVIDFSKKPNSKFKDTLLSSFLSQSVAVVEIPATATLLFGRSFNSQWPFNDLPIQYIIIKSNNKKDTMYNSLLNGSGNNLNKFTPVSNSIFPPSFTKVYTIQ